MELFHPVAKRLAAAAAWLAPALISQGCLFAEDVPADAVITCETSEDCPLDMVCARTKHCVPPGTESTAPSLEGAPQIAPAFARVGTVLSVSLSPTEPLALAPEVVLTHETSGDVRAMNAATSAPTFAFSYTVTELDAPGTWSGRAVLVDEVGNSGEASVGSVVVDTREPALVSVTGPTPPLVSAATPSVTIELSFDEPIAAAPVVTSRGPLGTEVLWPGVMGDDARAWRHEIAAGAQLADGLHTFSFSVVDAAGNAAGAPLAATLMVDRTPPAPTLVVDGGEDTVRAPTAGHDQVVLSVDARELNATIDMPLGACVGTGTTTADCTYGVSGLEGEFVTLTVAVSDTAGNAGSVDVTIPIDAVAPSVPANLVQIDRVPGPQNPLASVTRVTLGTTVELSFQTDEPLSQPPALTFGGLEMELTASAGTQHSGRFVLTPEAFAGGLADGPIAVRAELTDVLGNRATVDVGEVEIDTTPPEALVAARNDGIVYERDGASARVVSVAPAVLEDDGAMLVRNAAGQELGRTSAAPDGSFAAAALSTSSNTTVEVVHVDAAGNLSAAALVRTVDFVESSGAALDVRARTALLDDVPDGAAPSGLGPVTTDARATLFAFEQPAAPYALFFDAINDEHVALSLSGPMRFDGARWRRTQLRAPPPTARVIDVDGVDALAIEDVLVREEHYDDCDVLYCDPYNGFFAFHETTKYGAALHYRGDVATQQPEEVGVWRGAVPIKDASGQVIRIGGTAVRRVSWYENVVHWYGEQYEYLIEQVSVDAVASQSPPLPREWPGAVLDTDRGVIVAFGGVSTAMAQCASEGGSNQSECYLSYDGYTDESGQLYYWDLVANPGEWWLDDTWERAPDGTWTQVTPTDPEGDGNPAASVAPFMAYDPVTQGTLLHDGAALWIYDGVSWRALPPNDVEGDGEPVPPFHTAMFDAARGRLLVYADALYAFEGASFTRLSGALGPQPAHGTLVVSPADGVPYLYAPASTPPLWRRGAGAWDPVATTDPEDDGDPAANARVVGFDSAADPGVELAAADATALWLFADNSWRAAMPAPDGNALLIDVGDTLFAVSPYSVQWREGDAWQSDSVEAGPFGEGYGDEVLIDADVLPGALALTYAYSGGVSVHITSAQAPPFGALTPYQVAGYGVRSCPSTYCEIDGSSLPTCPGYDGWDAPTPEVTALGGEVLLFGGGDTVGSQSNNDNLGPCLIPELQPSDVRRLGDPGAVSSNVSIALADPEGDALPRGPFSTKSATDPLTGDVWFYEDANRMWRLHDGSADTPAVVMRSAPGAAALPLDAIVSIEVDVLGDAASGVALLRWDGATRAWLPVGSGDGASMNVDATDPAALAALWDDRREPIRLAVVPSDGGVGPVSVTQASVRTRYRLP